MCVCVSVRAPTMEVENEEASSWEIRVEADQHTGAGTVGRLQGCVAAEDSQLRTRRVLTIPVARRSETEKQEQISNSFSFNFKHVYLSKT